MNQRPHNHQPSGFTIVEVLIVLAIAGLILLVLFIAVPAAQRNARNDGRKRAVQLVAGALEEYNNVYGHYPRDDTEAAAFQAMNPEIFKLYSVELRSNGGSHNYWPPTETVAVEYSHWCNKYGNGNNATDPIAGDYSSVNLYVAWASLEPEKPSNVYCVDNYDHTTH